MHSLSGSYRLESEDGKELGPPGIGDTLGQMMVQHQVADPQVFVVDHVVCLYQLRGLAMVEVASLIADV